MQPTKQGKEGDATYQTREGWRNNRLDERRREMQPTRRGRDGETTDQTREGWRDNGLDEGWMERQQTRRGRDGETIDQTREGWRDSRVDEGGIERQPSRQGREGNTTARRGRERIPTRPFNPIILSVKTRSTLNDPTNKVYSGYFITYRYSYKTYLGNYTCTCTNALGSI